MTRDKNRQVNSAGYNNANQLVNRNGSGALRFRGSVNEPTSNATVAGSAATLDSGTNFTGYATVGPGSNTVEVIVTDYHTNTVAHYYSVVLSNGISQTLKYDLNGNLVTMTNTTTGAAMSNVWDAANRLVKIYSNGTYRSEFTYDGLSRRVRQTEINGGTTISDHRMLWCGSALCEERDSTGGTATKRFFRQGEQISGTNYFFNRDHLGSVREMTDNSGTIRARYNYDPWGRRTKVSGDLEADFGFTGHYYHAPSGLHLAMFRAYSADLGRWLSRDPIRERGGVNLYSYVQNDPLQWIDPRGLTKIHGNYCGGGFCGGKELKPGEKCDYSVDPTDAMDACCKDHDKCFDEVEACKGKKGGKKYADCHKAACDCIKKVDPYDSTNPGDEITWNTLKEYFCDMKGPPY